jgi:hypothetical protein
MSLAVLRRLRAAAPVLCCAAIRPIFAQELHLYQDDSMARAAHHDLSVRYLVSILLAHDLFQSRALQNPGLPPQAP